MADKAQRQKRQDFHHDDIRNDLYVEPQPVQADKTGRYSKNGRCTKTGQLPQR